MGLCGALTLRVAPHHLWSTRVNTWVDRGLEVATVRDDHAPTIAELRWQPVAPHFPVQWHCPVIDRVALVESEAAVQIRQRLSLAPTVPVGTPVNAHHAFVVSLPQL